MAIAPPVKPLERQKISGLFSNQSEANNLPVRPKPVITSSAMQITSLDYSAFVGRIAIGRVMQGTLKEGAQLGISKKDGSIKK